MVFQKKIKLFTFLLFLMCLIISKLSGEQADTDDNRFGILRTFSNLRYFAAMEFRLTGIIKDELAAGARGLQNHDPVVVQDLVDYVKDFNGSTVTHLLGLEWHYSDDELLDILVSNLILVFRMVYRFVRFGDSVREFTSVTRDLNGYPVCNLTDIYTHIWPGVPDYSVMLSTVSMIYKIHSLHVSPKKLVKGLTSASKTPTSLTAQMCHDIAVRAAQRRNYVDSIDWINYAIDLVRGGDTSIPLEHLQVTKLAMVENHNLDFHEFPEFHTGFYSNILPLEDVGTPREKIWNKRKDALDYFYRGRSSEVNINMWTLCFGLPTQKSDVINRLKCFLDMKSHPWLRINPLYVEVLSENPQVLKFHNILGERLIGQIMQKIGKNYMHVSRIASPLRDWFKQIHTRSSSQTWIPNEEFPRLTQISEVVSGRVIRNSKYYRSSEIYQVVEYVVGRHYVMHSDAGLHTEQDSEDGDRESTLLFYLNDVDYGGITAFGNIGILAEPQKGSAILWENMYRNGSLREDMNHCSCPVIQGRKLVINKWIRYNAQFRKKPCSLNQLE